MRKIFVVRGVVAVGVGGGGTRRARGDEKMAGQLLPPDPMALKGLNVQGLDMEKETGRPFFETTYRCGHARRRVDTGTGTEVRQLLPPAKTKNRWNQATQKFYPRGGREKDQDAEKGGGFLRLHLRFAAGAG